MDLVGRIFRADRRAGPLIHSVNIGPPEQVRQGIAAAYPDSVPFMIPGDPPDYVERPRNTLAVPLADAYRLFYRTAELIFTLEYGFRFEGTTFMSGPPDEREIRTGYTVRLTETQVTYRRENSNFQAKTIRENVLGARGWEVSASFAAIQQFDDSQAEDQATTAGVFFGGFAAAPLGDQSSPGLFYRLKDGRTAFNGVSINVFSGAGGFAFSSGPFGTDYQVGTAKVFGQEMGLFSSIEPGSGENSSRITTCNLTVEMGPDMPY